MPKEKINMGLALYGRTFALVNPLDHGVGAPSSGAATAGKYTRQSGFLAYYEVGKSISRDWSDRTVSDLRETKQCLVDQRVR